MCGDVKSLLLRESGTCYDAPRIRLNNSAYILTLSVRTARLFVLDPYPNIPILVHGTRRAVQLSIEDLV